MLLRQNGLNYKGPKLSARAVATSPSVVEAISANDYAKLSKAVEAQKGPLRPEMVEARRHLALDEAVFRLVSQLEVMSYSYELLYVGTRLRVTLEDIVFGREVCI